MMPCPKCGKDTQIRDSRMAEHGVKRRRVCPNGHKFTTLEVMADTKRGVSTVPGAMAYQWNQMLLSLRARLDNTIEQEIRQ